MIKKQPTLLNHLFVANGIKMSENTQKETTIKTFFVKGSRGKGGNPSLNDQKVQLTVKTQAVLTVQNMWDSGEILPA